MLMRSFFLSRCGFSIPCLAGAVMLLFSGCVTHETHQYLGANPRIAFNSLNMVDQTTMQFDESKPGVDWGMSLAWMGDHYLLTADQNTTPGKLTQSWQVVALQDIPLLRQGEMIALGSCRKWGTLVSRVAAIMKYQAGQQWITEIEDAWIYDYRKNGFEEYSLEHLECLNPRYGLGLDRPAVSATAVAPAAATKPKP
jgi:hypothetical protein